MAFIHHSTIRKYTAALISFFNNTEVQHKDSAGNTISKSVPLQYSTREKSKVFDEHTTSQLLDGNYNVLPRANISLSTVVKSDTRVQNKNAKINTVKSANSFDYQYNSVPYEFTYEYAVQCRGMNEATQIVEQIAPFFNPILNIDVWDGANLTEPTRVPVKLLDISIEGEEYEELSSNIVTVSFGIQINGNLYPPIRSTAKVQAFKILMNDSDGSYFSRKSILGWDVNDSGAPVNGTITPVQDTTTYAPNIVDIVGLNVVQGQNDLSVIYSDADNKLTELTFTWLVLSGTATITGSLDTAVLDVTAAGNVDVQVTITDPYGNYATISKVFTVA